MKLTEKRQQFLNHVYTKFGTGSEISKSDVESVMSELGIAHPYWFTDNFRTGRSLYKIPSLDKNSQKSFVYLTQFCGMRW